MLQDGIYSLQFAATREGAPETATGLAVLRGGQVLGSDPLGAVFAGTYEYDEARALNRVRLRVDVPADSLLITGFESGPDGATLHVAGAFGGQSADGSAFLQIAGAPLGVQIRYLGPLPN
jgi:hypothetical protein